MTLKLLVSSCDNGPCPAFHKTTGGVVVQGIKTNDPEHRPAGMPDHEGVLFIPDDAWERLTSRLFQQATGGST